MKDNDIEQEDTRLSGDCEEILVFLTATGLFMWYGLDPETWAMIAMIYVGGQSVIDTVRVWKHG